MKQPELGKKIAELRQNKGLTQSELAENCKLSLRTVQRIESTEVTPRSHTINIIFSYLGYDNELLVDNQSVVPQKTNQFKQVFTKYVLELFNLKTNIMKKLLVLVAALVTVGVFFMVSPLKAQKDEGNNAAQIIGVWKSVSGTSGERVKIITKGHFIWTLTLDNKIVASAGGTYTFDGENYTENIEFGTENMSTFFGKKAVVKIRFEGKKMDYIGKLAENIPLNEVWERIE